LGELRVEFKEREEKREREGEGGGRENFSKPPPVLQKLNTPLSSTVTISVRSIPLH
jgi:hypothetical protein